MQRYQYQNWNTEQVIQWLKQKQRIKNLQDEQIWRTNGITGAQLGALTHQQLEITYGIHSTLLRNRLLNDIQELQNDIQEENFDFQKFCLESEYILAEEKIQILIDSNQLTNLDFETLKKISKFLKEKLEYEGIFSNVTEQKYNQFESNLNDTQELQDNLQRLQNEIQPFKFQEFESISNTIIQTSDSLQKLQQQNAFIFLGSSGCGKSTSIQFLAGSQMINTPQGHFVVGQLGDVEEGNLRSVEISNNVQSCTKFINVIKFQYFDEINEEQYPLTLCDSAGFDDSRGHIQDIINQLVISKAITNCKSIVPIIVINKQDIDGRMNNCANLCQNLSKTFKDLEQIKRGFQFIFTNYKDSRENRENIKASINNLYEFRQNDQNPFLKILMNKVQRQSDILIIDPNDPENRKKILNKMIQQIQDNQIENPIKYMGIYLQDSSLEVLKKQNVKNLNIICNFGIEKNQFNIIKKKLHELKVIYLKLGRYEFKTDYNNAIEKVQNHIKNIFGDYKIILEQIKDYLIKKDTANKIKECMKKVGNLIDILDDHEKNDINIQNNLKKFDELLTELFQKYCKQLIDQLEKDKLYEDSSKNIIKSLILVHAEFGGIRQIDDSYQEVISKFENKFNEVHINQNNQVNIKENQILVQKLIFLNQIRQIYIDLSSKNKDSIYKQQTFFNHIEDLKTQLTDQIKIEKKQFEQILSVIFEKQSIEQLQEQQLKLLIEKLINGIEIQDADKILGENPWKVNYDLLIKDMLVKITEIINCLYEQLKEGNFTLEQLNTIRMQLELLKVLQNIIEFPIDDENNCKSIIQKINKLISNHETITKKLITESYQYDSINQNQKIQKSLILINELIWLDLLQGNEQIKQKSETITDLIQKLLEDIQSKAKENFNVQDFSKMNIYINKLNGFSDEHDLQFFKKHVLIKDEISEELKKQIENIDQYMKTPQSSDNKQAETLEKNLEFFKKCENQFDEQWNDLNQIIQETSIQFKEFVKKYQKESLEIYDINSLLSENDIQKYEIIIKNLQELIKNKKKFELLNNEVNFQNLQEQNQLKLEFQLNLFNNKMQYLKEKQQVDELRKLKEFFNKFEYFDNQLLGIKINNNCTFSSLYQKFNNALQDIESDESNQLQSLIDNNFYSEFLTIFKSFQYVKFRNYGINLMKSHLKNLHTSLEENIQKFINGQYQQQYSEVSKKIQIISQAIKEIDEQHNNDDQQKFFGELKDILIQLQKVLQTTEIIFNSTIEEIIKDYKKNIEILNFDDADKQEIFIRNIKDTQIYQKHFGYNKQNHCELIENSINIHFSKILENNNYEPKIIINKIKGNQKFGYMLEQFYPEIENKIKVEIQNLKNQDKVINNQNFSKLFGIIDTLPDESAKMYKQEVNQLIQKLDQQLPIKGNEIKVQNNSSHIDDSILIFNKEKSYQKIDEDNEDKDKDIQNIFSDKQNEQEKLIKSEQKKNQEYQIIYQAQNNCQPQSDIPIFQYDKQEKSSLIEEEKQKHPYVDQFVLPPEFNASELDYQPILFNQIEKQIQQKNQEEVFHEVIQKVLDVSKKDFTHDEDLSKGIIESLKDLQEQKNLQLLRQLQEEEEIQRIIEESLYQQ